jgi:hypothetical protein
MKTIQKLLFLALIYLSMPSALVAQARRPEKSVTPDKPFIFSRLPARFECSATSLKQLFHAQLNDQVQLSLSANTVFAGVVNARVEVDANTMSVNILSSNFPGTLLTISLMKQSDGSEKMTGMFLNPQNGDMLMLEQDKDKYVIRKQLSKFVMTECPLPEQKKGNATL